MSTKVVAETVRVDKGAAAIQALVKRLSASDPHVRVGIFADASTGGARREGGLTNVEIAAIHEFGAPEAGIPERSFIRSTFEANRDTYHKMVAKLLPRVLEEKLTIEQLFDIVGQKIVADINKKVRVEGVPPPLAASTIARKGSSRALIDTGRMLAALTYVTVVDNARVAAST